MLTIGVIGLMCDLIILLRRKQAPRTTLFRFPELRSAERTAARRLRSAGLGRRACRRRRRVSSPPCIVFKPLDCLRSARIHTRASVDIVPQFDHPPNVSRTFAPSLLLGGRGDELAQARRLFSVKPISIRNASSSLRSSQF